MIEATIGVSSNLNWPVLSPQKNQSVSLCNTLLSENEALGRLQNSRGGPGSTELGLNFTARSTWLSRHTRGQSARPPASVGSGVRKNFIRSS
jgi:hypothetical protein